MPRLLLLMPTTTYRAEDFLAAAAKLGVEVVYGSNRCKVLDALGAVDLRHDSLILDFDRPALSLDRIRDYHQSHPLTAVIATDDQTTLLGAEAAASLGLPRNSIRGVARTRDKLRLRAALTRAGLPQARFSALALGLDPEDAARRAERWPGYPLVLKPRGLSASRGVIRADHRVELVAAYQRLSALLALPAVKHKSTARADVMVLESFIPGTEVALEGLLSDGALSVLAIFDKPDPLDGPFFEETLYITPSRLPAATQIEIGRTVAAGARALGLVEGPIHAELRLNTSGVFLLEIAPRSIGGLCSRTLKFGLGISLEELLIRHALGEAVSGLAAPPDRERSASGVMMLPIPRTGMLKRVGGLEAAKAVPRIEDVVITQPIDREVVALPEGDAYLGFAFARGESPEAVEAALRDAHRRIDLEIGTVLPLARS